MHCTLQFDYKKHLKQEKNYFSAIQLFQFTNIIGVQRRRMAGTLLWPTKNPNMSQVYQNLQTLPAKNNFSFSVTIFWNWGGWFLAIFSSHTLSGQYYMYHSSTKVWKFREHLNLVYMDRILRTCSFYFCRLMMLIKIWLKNGSFLNYVFRDVFNKSYCCYGNLLCHENDDKVLINDWVVLWYYDCSNKW